MYHFHVTSWFFTVLNYPHLVLKLLALDFIFVLFHELYITTEALLRIYHVLCKLKCHYYSMYFLVYFLLSKQLGDKTLRGTQKVRIKKKAIATFFHKQMFLCGNSRCLSRHQVIKHMSRDMSNILLLTLSILMSTNNVKDVHLSINNCRDYNSRFCQYLCKVH